MFISFDDFHSLTSSTDTNLSTDNFSHDSLSMDIHNFSTASDSDNNFYHEHSGTFHVEHSWKQDSPIGAINAPSDYNSYTDTTLSDSNTNVTGSTDNSTNDSD